MLASLITALHFSVSALSNTASSSGVEPIATMADVLEFCLDGRIAQCGDRIDVDFLNDLARRPGRNEEREPSRHVEVGDAGLRNGRQLRRQLTPLRGRHRKSANLAAPDLLKHRAAADLQVNPAGD